jgi:hypothetical protein
MATDLFNNPSTDYVYPTLTPCAGAASDSNLEFVRDGIGVVSGNDILAEINFKSIKIPVVAYSKETKIIREGEVIYIPGLTKGLVKRTQYFTMPNLTSLDEGINNLFFQLDCSINYYKNFSFTYSNIDVSANYSNNITVADAVNIAFDSAGIKTIISYDPSVLAFIGTQDGYDFSVSNVKLTLIDSSENVLSAFAHGVNDASYNLVEDVSSNISAAKYPNGGMQGIIMKGIYPSTSGSCSSGSGSPNNWLYINKPYNPVVSYETIDVSSVTYYVKKSKQLDVGMSGASTATIMSAGDYLKWITDNNMWNKFGDIFIWTSAMDCVNQPEVNNLLNGIYLFNPHLFDIKVEYMVFI